MDFTASNYLNLIGKSTIRYYIIIKESFEGINLPDSIGSFKTLDEAKELQEIINNELDVITEITTSRGISNISVDDFKRKFLNE